MIITYSKTYESIKSQLCKEDKIEIAACNACAKICETGGQDKMNELAEKLEKDGFNVVDKTLIPRACSIDMARGLKHKKDVLIILACDAGVYVLKKLFPEKKVINALNTIGLGTKDDKGKICTVREF